jgi:excisionase family DNA binding protein
MSKDSRRRQRRDELPPAAAINAVTPKDVPPKLRHSITEAAQMLGISRALVYQRIEQGHLTPVHDGRRILVTDAEIRRYAEISRP